MPNQYTDLVAWRLAMDLVIVVYEASSQLPDNERYGLTSQMRRAAISVPANIAEGQGRKYRPDFKRFLLVAHGSLCELETHVRLASRLGLITEPTMRGILERTGEAGRVINGLIRSLPVEKNTRQRRATDNRQLTTDN